MKIKDWYLIKNDSKRAQTVFVDSEYHSKASHFAFAFTTKNVSDLFNFTMTLLDGSDNKITFPFNKTKVPTLRKTDKFTSRAKKTKKETLI